jgi:hypothetical protein
MYLTCILAMALTLSPLGPVGPPQDTSSPPSPSTPTGNTQTPPADQNPPAAQPEAPGSDSAKKGAKSSATKRHSRKRASSASPSGPRKIVVHQGGATEPVAQIMPGISQEEASRQRQTAEQLLASTESNLKLLAARTLNATQQETVAQIRNYMDGARSALTDGDTQRARTLALKAHLLSDDLVKH